ncbi:carbohydrate ABC transporter permease [Cohnella sp. WQ 127256]|uniref:carbohydrate ABC transporter permease n=1 Tax=Cohnella sp. WQ 127256 TaxID=2938790 RepID=UPI0021185EB9
MKKALKQYVEVSPYLLAGFVLTIVFVFYPILRGVYMSFFDYALLHPADSRFIGLDNYVKAFHDPKFYLALRNTLIFSLVTVPGQWLFGIVAAMLINLRFLRFKVVFRLVYYIPVITSWVVVAYLFKYLFADGAGGLINYLLVEKLHLVSSPINWLSHTWTASAVIWLLSIWKGVGYVMVLYLAALQSIPKSLYEAAEIDGAKSVQNFIHITLPLMKPMTLFVLVNLIIGSFNVFIQVYLITDGGPLGSTEVFTSYLFKHAFKFLDFGYASALGLILGLLILAFTWGFQRNLGQEKVEY